MRGGLCLLACCAAPLLSADGVRKSSLNVVMSIVFLWFWCYVLPNNFAASPVAARRGPAMPRVWQPAVVIVVIVGCGGADITNINCNIIAFAVTLN